MPYTTPRRTGAFERLADRLFGNWRTSVLAALIIVILAILGVTETVAWEKLYGFISGPLVLFLFRDDTVIEREKEKAVKKAIEESR